LLGGIQAQPDGFSGVILSAPAAEMLGIAVGDLVQGRISRTLKSGEREAVGLDLQVDAVLPPAHTDRLEAFVSLPFLIAAEDYREGFAVESLGAGGQIRPEGERYFASFRLYARTIADVADLRLLLAASGVNSDTRLAEIELIQGLDHSLGVLFAVVAGLGGSGYLISLTVSLWANTERKRRELSVLRLMGLRSIELAVFPALQALFTALLGVLLATLMYLPVERLVNVLFRGSLAEHQVLGRLEPQHFAAAAGITLGFALLASLAASVRSARVTPAEGLRDE
jgi:putative ABC transport system permease protein